MTDSDGIAAGQKVGAGHSESRGGDARGGERIVKQPPVLFEQSQKFLAEIERLSGMPAIIYWNAWNGSICPNDVPALYRLLSSTGQMERAAIVIKSHGGDIESALRLVHLLRRHVKHLTAVAFSECASAATIVALGADQIKMGPLGYLTPIDTSLSHSLAPIDQIGNKRVNVSRDELRRIVRLWNESAREHHGNPYTDLFNFVHPLVFGAIDRSNSLSAKICEEVLSYHIDDKAGRQAITTALNTEFPSHGYPVTEITARRLGLKVSDLDSGVNQQLLELNECYSEMAQSSITDFDEFNYHDNQILGLIEVRGLQIYYQNDKDMNYIQSERRWQSLNDESAWKKVEFVDGQTQISRFHIG